MSIPGNEGGHFELSYSSFDLKAKCLQSTTVNNKKKGTREFALLVQYFKSRRKKTNVYNVYIPIYVNIYTHIYRNICLYI